MSVRILCLGDIVGRPGRRAVADLLPPFRRDRAIDFVVANGENAASGSGLTPKVLQELLDAGVDVVTSGDHIYKNKDVAGCIEHERLLRPANLVPQAAGRGCGVYTVAEGLRLGVLNLQGRVFMDPSECPFRAADLALARWRGQVQLFVVDMHAEATSEKIAMGWHLDGRVTAVVGTHTHVQTADERVLPAGTGYLTDLGMTGPHDGIIGRRTKDVLQKFTTAMPTRFEVCKGEVQMNGLLVEADPSTGRATAVERLSLPLPATKDKPASDPEKKA